MQPEPSGGTPDWEDPDRGDQYRGDPDRGDADRVVSRRVENPTGAEPGDDAVYRAADPVPGDEAGVAEPEQGGPGHATTAAAAAEIAESDDSEPHRSE